jgi:hypothetical protein
VHRSPCDCDSGQTTRIGLRKTALVLLSTVGAILAAHGEDLTTTTGKTYHDIQVLSRSSSSVLIQSKEGEFQFSMSELKPADREKYSKNLTKAIDLPALTVIGEQKADFTTPQEPTRTEKFAEKEFQRQQTEKDEAHKKQLESYQPFQIFRGVTFSLLTDPKNDAATLPDYLNPDYGRQSPDIVEKDLKIFANSINNPSP